MRRGELLRIARTRWVLPGDVNIYVADRGASVMIPIFDPDHLEYIPALPTPGRRAKAWRWLGAMFKRPAWKRRGMFYPPPRMAPFRGEEIELHRYAGEPELHSMGYGPETNTLVVRMATVAL